MDQFSPASFTLLQFGWPLLLALAGGVVAGFAGALEGRPWRAFGLYFGVGIPIAFVGYATGFLTGISRNSGAMANLLPAVLALIGGVSVYAFGSENKYRAVVGYCVCLLIVSLFYGTQRGASDRETYREARLKSLFELERRLINYRKNRQLPDKASDWLSLGETGGK